MKLKSLHVEDRARLEHFVAAHLHGCIEQSWVWGELQASIPGREEFFVLGLWDEKELVASMLCVRQHMGHGKTWLWCPGGPLLPEGREEVAWGKLLAGLRKEATRAGDVFLRVEPNWGDRFELGGRSAGQSYLPRHTLVLDLTFSEKTLLEQMKQKGRYNIKKATKAGVVVSESGLEELPAVYQLLSETAERDGFHLHKEDFYAAFLQLEESRLYTAHVEGELVGALFATHFGGSATYYFGASSNHHRKTMAPYALQWHAIQEAKKAGCTSYDFLGVAPEGDDQHALAGVTQFKTRFGGARVDYSEARVFVFRSLWWWTYRAAKAIRGK